MRVENASVPSSRPACTRDYASAPFGAKLVEIVAADAALDFGNCRSISSASRRPRSSSCARAAAPASSPEGSRVRPTPGQNAPSRRPPGSRRSTARCRASCRSAASARRRSCSPSCRRSSRARRSKRRPGTRGRTVRAAVQVVEHDAGLDRTARARRCRSRRSGSGASSSRSRATGSPV